MGIRNFLPVSAEHGDGVAELLEAILEVVPAVPDEQETDSNARSRSRRKRQRISIPEDGSEERRDPAAPTDAADNDLEESAVPAPDDSEAGEFAQEEEAAEIKVAIIGRPNVGKSTLLNQLSGSQRSIVSPVAGTTRDAVDEVVERNGQSYRFIDTAGIRRKGKTRLMAEKLSVVMARKHLEAADVVLMMIDAVEGVSALDATIAGYAHEAGRSLILVVNKWDLVTTGRPEGGPAADSQIFEEQARRVLKFLGYAPMLFISASTGRNVEKVFPAIELVARERRKRISTGEMNRFLRQVDFDRASVPAARKVKVYYMTQAAISPPTFVLFTDKDVKLHFSYERFLENQIRKQFQFTGTPIWIKTRPRKNRK